MSLKIRSLSRNTIISTIFFSIVFVLGITVQFRFLSMVGLFGMLIYYIFALKKQSYLGVAFLISFFVFLLGRIFVNWLTNEPSLLIGAFIYDDGPKDADLTCMLLIFFVSIICFCWGVLIVPNNSKGEHIALNKKIDYKALEKAFIILFCLTLVFEYAVSIERLIFLYIGGSYTSYYTSFVRIMPSIVYKIAELNKYAFFSVLAILPSKKKTKPILALYLIDGLILLLGGQRNPFVRALMICICYMLIRNKKDCEEIWLSKRQSGILMCLAPILVIGLQIWGTMRNGDSFISSGIINTISSFFQDQGTTSVVVYKGLELKDNFPVGVNYVFAPITNFLMNNQLTKLIFHPVIYAQQSAELALYGNNFGATLTYLYIPHNYLMGIGMGSSYVIEAFFDYSWIGVIIINFIYGILLAKMENMLCVGVKSVWVGVILLLFVNGILYAPRDAALSFITDGLNFSIVLFYVLSTLLANVLIRKGARDE